MLPAITSPIPPRPPGLGSRPMPCVAFMCGAGEKFLLLVKTENGGPLENGGKPCPCGFWSLPTRPLKQLSSGLSREIKQASHYFQASSLQEEKEYLSV